MNSSDPPRADGQLLRAIAELPDPLREVVRLTLEQRHGRREVARLLDLDVEEVRIRIRKGLEILSREVDLEALRKRLE